jgi:pimeloyl-ACP methyl ester carboxylesterase
MRAPVAVPVLQVHGSLDGVSSPASSTTPPALLAGPLHYEVLTTAGHFPHEETPELFNELLLEWLQTL